MLNAILACSILLSTAVKDHTADRGVWVKAHLEGECGAPPHLPQWSILSGPREPNWLTYEVFADTFGGPTNPNHQGKYSHFLTPGTYHVKVDFLDASSSIVIIVTPP
jgi:hypothetical protein